MNYTVSTNDINGAINFGAVLLTAIISTSISAGVYLNIYNTPRNKNKFLFIEAINKFKLKTKTKKKEL